MEEGTICTNPKENKAMTFHAHCNTGKCQIKGQIFHRFNISTKRYCNYSKVNDHGSYKMSEQNVIIHTF